MNPKLIRYFLRFAAVVLLITGIAKIVAAFDSSRALDTIDPVFGIPFRVLGPTVGVLEGVVALICLGSRNALVNVAIVAGLSTSFLLYRVALYLLHWEIPCRCLGSLTGALPLSAKTAGTITACLLGVLIAGSYSILACEWLGNRKKPQSAPV